MIDRVAGADKYTWTYGRRQFAPFINVEYFVGTPREDHVKVQSMVGRDHVVNSKRRNL